MCRIMSHLCLSRSVLPPTHLESDHLQSHAADISALVLLAKKALSDLLRPERSQLAIREDQILTG